MDAEIVVVGAGLSGLALAQALITGGREVRVLEARDRPGGRILSDQGYDLGPAWIWPHNHRMLALAQDLGLNVFPQYSQGRLVFEDARGAIRRDLDFATMGGALRVEGGLSQITDALARGLGQVLHPGHTAQNIQEDETGVTVSTSNGRVRAERVVLALPPRIAAGLGVSVPDVPTWMAGQAKLVALYDTPFWRRAGLSGDAISHMGPLAEMHDASPADGRAGALFGFALPGTARDPNFSQHALAQLSRLFGPEAATPSDVLIKDWSSDPNTATMADVAPPQAHPHYRPIPLSDRLIFAGTETAPTEGGFLEGALVAAEAAQDRLSRAMA